MKQWKIQFAVWFFSLCARKYNPNQHHSRIWLETAQRYLGSIPHAAVSLLPSWFRHNPRGSSGAAPGPVRMTVADLVGERSFISYSVSLILSLHKPISSSGEISPLHLTGVFGSHPAQAPLVPFAARRRISTASSQAVQGFNLQTWMLPPHRPEGMVPGSAVSKGFPSACELMERLLGKEVAYLARTLFCIPCRRHSHAEVRGLSPLTFPDPVAMNIHLVDVGLHWAAMPGRAGMDFKASSGWMHLLSSGIHLWNKQRPLSRPVFH